MSSKPAKLVAAIVLGLAIGIVAAADPEAGKIVQGGSPLFTAPGTIAVDQIVCTLSENTPVLLVGERPLVGPDGKVAFPGFYKNVQVVDGACAGKTGWVSHEKYSRR
jgi:hypothetical protein